MPITQKKLSRYKMKEKNADNTGNNDPDTIEKTVKDARYYRKIFIYRKRRNIGKYE